MKRLASITILLLAVVIVRANPVSTMTDLKPGDSFSLKITLPVEGAKPALVWDYGNCQKIDVDFKVLKVENDSVHFSIVPKSWYACFPNLDHQDLMKKMGVGVNNFLYSYYYHEYADIRPEFDLFDGDNVIVSVNTSTGKSTIRYNKIAEDRQPNQSREKWHRQLIDIPKGFKFIRSDGAYSYAAKIPDLNLDFAKTIEFAINCFFNRWNDNSLKSETIPLLLDLREKSKEGKDLPSFVNIMSASFPLPFNISVVFNAPEDLAKDLIFIEFDGCRIKPIRKENNTYTFQFFLPEPKRVSINDVKLALSPNDSILVNYNKEEKQYSLSGNGSSNSLYNNEIAMLYDGKLYSDEKQEVLFRKGEEYHRMLLDKYKNEMNAYWIKSAELAFDYWYARENIRIFVKNSLMMWDSLSEDKGIPWFDKHFTNLFPFTDYLYQPSTYGKFIDNFFVLKSSQTNNSILTGMNYFNWNGTGKYYFTDAVFWGYPRLYLTSNCLIDLMKKFHLNASEREYEDFMSKCKVPEMRNSMIHLHDKLEKIEPGANIKGLNLAVEKYIPLKKSDSDYIVLLVTDSLNNNPKDPLFEQRMNSFYQEMANEQLTEKVKICVITAESVKSMFSVSPETQNRIVFVPDKDIRDYQDKVLADKGIYLILRSDGTIIDRMLNSNRMDYPSSIMRFTIKRDILKQKNKDSAASRVLPILFTCLISTVFAFFVARYFVKRKEQQRRKMVELELKAIRAQMNPHFTFNALASIQNLISQKKEKEADAYLVNFAKLLRMVLSSSEKKLVPLSDEISMIELYLNLEQLRVPFDYSIRIDENIDIETEEIPGMLIQPIVENAVKHAIAPKHGGHIDLHFALNRNVLSVVVTDTGNGYSEEVERNANGFGLKAVRERLSLLKKELHLDIRLKMENSVEDGAVKGCKVSLSIPV